MSTQYERNQADPRWLEWVAPERMQAETAQLIAEVPDMPEDPWSLEGLRRVERFILDRFPTMDDVDPLENRALADRLARYIGEAFHRLFESKWENHPEEYSLIERYPDFGPAVANEWTEFPLAVGNVVTAIIDRQSGEHLALIYQYRVEDYAEWVSAGRPPRAEYLITE